MSGEHAAAPHADVLRAFGTASGSERLSDGAHATWRSGDVVLKPADITHEQLRWQASLLQRVAGNEGFRVPQMIEAEDGRLVVEGWYAMTFLPGRHEPGRWIDIVSVGSVFHEAVAAEPAPPFLEARGDPWSIGDRVAWAGSSIPRTSQPRSISVGCSRTCSRSAPDRN